MTEPRLPLQGTRVICLAHQYPGPYGTLILADLGAEVIIVEGPDRGDPARGPLGTSPFFAAINRNKQSITLNLKDPAGQRICRELIDTADVLIEGFRPGVADRLGVGPDSVMERWPGLIYCSISGYGQTGPYRDRIGHDLSFQGMAGLLNPAVSAHGPGVALADISSAMFAAIAIVAALLRQHVSGAGDYIDISMYDSLASWMTPTLAAVQDSEQRSSRGAEPAYGTFECGDGHHLTLSIAHEDHLWRNLCAAIGLDELADLRGPERRARSGDLGESLTAVMRTRTRDDWVDALEAAGVPVAPVLSAAQVVRDAQLMARGMFQEAADSDAVGRYVLTPVRYRNAAKVTASPAPALGQHTDGILSALGYSPEQIARLREAGIV